VTLIWADGAILNQWVEVTVFSDAGGGGLGLVEDEVFYFGHVTGDCDGDGEVGSDDYGTFAGEFGQRGDIGTLAADLNGDGRVGLTDFAIIRGAQGNSVLAPTIPAAPALPQAAPDASFQLTAAPITVDDTFLTPAANTIFHEDDLSDVNDDTISTAAPVAAVDLIVESPSASGYASGSRPVTGDSPAIMAYRAMTAGHDLRTLSEDPGVDEVDDLLVDILAESPLAIPL